MLAVSGVCEKVRRFFILVRAVASHVRNIWSKQNSKFSAFNKIFSKCRDQGPEFVWFRICGELVLPPQIILWGWNYSQLILTMLDKLCRDPFHRVIYHLQSFSTHKIIIYDVIVTSVFIVTSSFSRFLMLRNSGDWGHANFISTQRKTNFWHLWRHANMQISTLFWQLWMFYTIKS